MLETDGHCRGGEGEPLVLLHGFTDTWRCWRPVLTKLAEHHDVFAFTLPGHHGGGPYPEGETLSIDGAADIIERRLEAEGIDRAHFAGSSLGGWLALELASRGRALSVVGVCPAGGWEPGSREERQVIRFFRNNDRLLRHTSRRMLRLVATRPRLRRIAMRDLVGYPDRITAEAANSMFLGALECEIVNDALDLAGNQDAYGDLTGIECRVRILYGTRDRIIRWPTHYTKMRRLLPDADWVALDGLGHLPMHDDPELVASRILEVTTTAAPVERAAS